jgi:hypothetical protein
MSERQTETKAEPDEMLPADFSSQHAANPEDAPWPQPSDDWARVTKVDDRLVVARDDG